MGQIRMEENRTEPPNKFRRTMAGQPRQSHAERAMRKFLFALPTFAAAFAAANQVAARDYPFCIQGGRGDCSFASYQQCQATASGRSAYGGINPAFRNSQASIKSALSHRN
jgi:Protein of unknown function (DUF3551)